MTESSRPSALLGNTHKIDVPCGKGYLIVNKDAGGRVVELFFNIGKNGQCRRIMTDTAMKYASILLQAGLRSLTDIASDLADHECEHFNGSPDCARSCLDAIAMRLRMQAATEVKDDATD